MALILLVTVQSRVFTAKCSELQTENSDVGVEEEELQQKKLSGFGGFAKKTTDGYIEVYANENT